MTQSKRLKLIRKKLHLTQEQLGQKLGIKGITIRRYENELNELPLMLIYALAGLFNVNPDWLKNGKGPMFLPENNSSSYDYIPVPYIRDGFASLKDNELTNENTPIFMNMNADILKNMLITNYVKNPFVINVIGDSMIPTLNPNELILVNPIENEDAIITGAIYVILIDNEYLIKRIEKNPLKKEINLISDNKNYSIINIKGDEIEKIKFIGRVVAKSIKL